MLKQSPSRNLRSKGNFKVKDALQICVLLVICIWLLYQAKQTYNKKVSDLENSINKIPKEAHTGHELLKLGRKDINPRLGELAAEFEKHEHEDDQEQGGDESIPKENDKGKGDDEIDGGDQEKAEEEETEQLDELIDEDDGEKGEGRRNQSEGGGRKRR